MAPRVRDRWPGGLGIIAAMVKNFKVGYPGKYLDFVYCTNLADQTRRRFSRMV